MTHSQSLDKLEGVGVLLGGISTFPGEYDFPRSLASRPGTRAASSLSPSTSRHDGAVMGSVVG
jgi:hypothetical protein